MNWPRWWQWPTVLSLDAPAVALAWQALAAEQSGTALPGQTYFVLGASVWLAYSADRWIEGWRVPPERIRTHRHAFAQRARWPLAAVWLLVFAADLAVAWRGLDARQLHAGPWLMPAVLLYLFSHQHFHRDLPRRLPKEVCVALLLAGGILVLTAPLAPAEGRVGLGITLGLFALLAFANCGLISAWERWVDDEQGQDSLARRFPAGKRVAQAAAVGAIFTGAVLCCASWSRVPAGAAGVASGLLLLAVDRAERRLTWRAARVLADAVLLTPFLTLLLR